MTDHSLVARYLDRIGLDSRPEPTVDGLARLMQAHMTRVPFENLDVFFQRGVVTDQQQSLHKIVDRGRGGWCFELNGAFAALLSALDFDVRLLGAAVLLGGPNRLIDHLTLEVAIDDEAHLVDVGFGDGFARPLPLNTAAGSGLDGHTGTYGFMASAEGTTLVRHTDEGPVPQYRFRRVSLELSDFDAAADRLYQNVDGNFRQGPVATRLLDGGPDRVTLTSDRLRLVRAGAQTDRSLEPDSPAWHEALATWFDIDLS